MNPYIINAQPLDFQQITPDTRGQQQFEQMMQQQIAQQAQQAGQVPQSNNAALAQLLRGNKPNPYAQQFKNAVNPYMPWTQLKTANQYGTNPYSEQSLMLAKQNQGF